MFRVLWPLTPSVQHEISNRSGSRTEDEATINTAPLVSQDLLMFRPKRRGKAVVSPRVNGGDGDQGRVKWSCASSHFSHRSRSAGGTKTRGRRGESERANSPTASRSTRGVRGHSVSEGLEKLSVVLFVDSCECVTLTSRRGGERGVGGRCAHTS